MALSSTLSNISRLTPREATSWLYSRVAFLTASAVILSGATIIYFNSTLWSGPLDRVCNGVELAAVTLMPYMIAAAVAAITAIGVLALLPVVKLQEPTRTLQRRLHQLARGDLSTRLAVPDKLPEIQEMVSDLNLTVATLGSLIARWKLINRQQWELLQTMREITVVDGQAQLVRIIEQMEANWEKIAEIEEKLVT